MPRLSDIGDPSAVDNRYADKVIVYVEGVDDMQLFSAITGPDVREHLEFQTPTFGGSGSGAVMERVRSERPGNAKVFGLLDGEVTAGIGEINTLVLCSDLIFTINRADLDGLLFLGQHEAENLLLLHGDLKGLIQRDVALRDYGLRRKHEIERHIARVVQRFFRAALLKYASDTLRYSCKAQGDHRICVTIDSKRFMELASPGEIMERIRAEVKQDGVVTWEELIGELRRTHRLLRTRFRAEQMNAQERNEHRLRLADGKAVLKRLRAKYSPKGHWESHLLDVLVRSDFSPAFRRRLEELTAA